MERDCAESQSQQHLRLAVTPNLLRLVLRTQPRSGLPAKFTDNLWMHWAEGHCLVFGCSFCSAFLFSIFFFAPASPHRLVDTLLIDIICRKPF